MLDVREGGGGGEGGMDSPFFSNSKEREIPSKKKRFELFKHPLRRRVHY